MTQVSVLEIQDIVLGTLRRLVPEATGELGADATIEELGIDSMTLMDLVLELEDQFSVTFPDDGLARIQAVHDVFDIVQELVGPHRP
jgi:acyl carrier protein